MKEKKNTILFIIDINGLSYTYISDGIDVFKEAIYNKKNIENADEISIVLTDFKYESDSSNLRDYAEKLKCCLDKNIKVFIYPFKNTYNIDILNMSSKKMEYENSHNKYDFIQSTINRVNNKYNVVYTALMQNISDFSINEEFQAKEQIEVINKMCRFELLLNSGMRNEYENIYNDHLVVSDTYGLNGFAYSLSTKIAIDNGKIFPMKYHEFYRKKKRNNGSMLIIIDSDFLGNYENIDEELLDNIICKKNEVDADEIYIIVSNQISNNSKKHNLKDIVYEIKYVLGQKAKYFIKENTSNDNYQINISGFDDNNSFLEHATGIKNLFSRRYRTNFIYTAYFTNALSYKNINIFTKEKMDDSEIEFFAHSAENDINGIVCSNTNGLDALNDCLIYSMNKSGYKDNDTIINNEEITVFYCDIQGTIDDIFGYEYYMKDLSDKLIELKKTNGSNKILFSLITNDSSLSYLTEYINKLKPELNDPIIFTDHFFEEGALIDGVLIEERETIGDNKFAKIKYHLNKLINEGYKINSVYFADDNMYTYDVNSFYKYIPDDINGQLLIPGFDYVNVPNNIIVSNQLNIAGLIECINTCIELCSPIKRGTAYSKQYITNKVDVDDDDDLPF